MADRKKRFRIGLVVLLAISLFVCPLAAGGLGLRGANAQIAFTPNISTLELTRTVEGPGLGLVETVEPGVLLVETRIPVTDGAWIVEGLTSDEASARCGETLSWGDRNYGYCQPTETTYYMWVEPDVVMEVLIDPANTSQNRFIAAVEARASDLRAFERDLRTLGWKIPGLGASLLGLPFACATVVLCIIDGGAFIFLGGWTAATAQNLVDLYNSSQTNARRAAFYNCRMQGNAYTACLTVAGITDEELGGDYE